MAVEHCHDNGIMSRQKMSRNPEETLELCRDISIDCHDKTKGRMKKECRDIAKFVVTKADKSSQRFVVITVFMSRQNLPEISSTWKRKNVETFQTFSRQLLDGVS